MDLILINGNIKTMEESMPYAEAIRAHDSIIVKVGTTEEILADKKDTDEVIDLKGAFCYPGFMDSHMHLADTGYLKSKLDLGGVKSLQEFLQKIAEEAGRLKRMQTEDTKPLWIAGCNFNQNNWEDEKRLPTREELDRVSGDLPCHISRVCGHVSVNNTAAMEIMGLMDKREGCGLNMTYLEDATPSGQMFESEAGMADDYMDPPSKEDYRKWIKEETKLYAKKGLTAIHSDDLNLIDPKMSADMVMEAFKEAAESGEMSIHVYEQCRIQEPEVLRDFAKKYPFGTTYGSRREFKTVSMKEMMDGSLGAHSAYLRKEYLNDPGNMGIRVHTQEEIDALVKAASENGYPVAAHCIGDAAVDSLLTAFEREGGKDMRNGVVHCQIMAEDQLTKMADMGILAYVQPVFVGTDAPIVEACVGEETARSSYNWRKMRDLGIHVSAGTDCPVEVNDPISNFYYAVTRDGGNGTPWRKENALTREEAMEALTIEGAYAAYEEERRGSLKTGKYLDMTVLDTDLMTVEEDRIRAAKVLMTIVDGRVVYQA